MREYSYNKKMRNHNLLNWISQANDLPFALPKLNVFYKALQIRQLTQEDHFKALGTFTLSHGNNKVISLNNLELSDRHCDVNNRCS